MNRMRSFYYRIAALCLLVMLGAATVFSHFRSAPKSPDEQAYLAWALSFALEGEIAEPDGRSVTKSVPPLHTLLVGFAFKSLGVETEVAQAVSGLGGALCVGVCFLLGYTILGVRGGLLAAMLLLTSGKGEIWEYSNRVLNDIYLTLWVSCILLCGVMYVRRGSLLMALAIGLALGLGILTKESTILAFPVIIAALYMVRNSSVTRVLHFLIVVGVAFVLITPWVLHRHKVREVQAVEQGRKYGLRAGNLSTLLDSEKWGFRGFDELGDNLLLRGMPSGPFRVIYGVSLLCCFVLLWRRRAPKELILPLLLILTWLGVFQVFLPLPMTRRQLVPLFPAYNLLGAFLLVRSWEFLKERLARGRIDSRIMGLVGCAGGIALAVLNMPPQYWSQVRPGRLLENSRPLFLEKEATEALACAPDAAMLASNFDRVLYFVVRGKVPVLRMPAPRGSKTRGHGRLEQEKKKLDTPPSPPQERFQLALPLYAITFCPGETHCSGLDPAMGEPWELTCQGTGFIVSRWGGGKGPG